MVYLKRLSQFGALGLAVAMSVPAMGFQKPSGKSSNDTKSSSTGRFRPGPRAGDWLRRNMNTPPAQQKQELEKSEDFKKLPPQQQQRMLNQLNRFNNMSPEQKNRVLSHIDRFDRLSPEEKERAEALHQQFHQLPTERRQAIRRALFGMRDMNPDERQKSLDSGEMKSNFSEQERQIMKGYTSLGFPDQHAEPDGGGNPQQEM
jgi:phage-related protein